MATSMNVRDAKRRRYWKKIDKSRAANAASINAAMDSGDTAALLGACAGLLNDVTAALLRIQYDLNEARKERADSDGA